MINGNKKAQETDGITPTHIAHAKAGMKIMSGQQSPMAVTSTESPKVVSEKPIKYNFSKK